MKREVEGWVERGRTERRDGRKSKNKKNMNEKREEVRIRIREKWMKRRVAGRESKEERERKNLTKHNTEFTGRQNNNFQRLITKTCIT